MTRLIPASLAALGALGLATAAHSGLAADPDMEKMKDHDNGRKIGTTLSGQAEVPGPGDPDGMGRFAARVNPGQGTLCYELDVDDIEAAAAAHIHRGARDVAGPVVVTLDLMIEDDDSERCMTIDRDLAQELIRNPDAFYVNVHNAEYPAGAVRGQLSK